MPGIPTKKSVLFPENVIPLFQKEWSVYKQNGGTSPEAFRIRCRDIYYVSVLFPGCKSGIQGRGFAVFKSGEQINFTINGNGDSKVRDRCIKAGERIATVFRSTLEHGTINHQGRFHPAAG